MGKYSDQNESGQQENKMGTMPIPRLLFSMSFPVMLSLLVQALYNVVDSMFVSRLSEDALTAVSLAFPVQSLMTAVSVGTGIGIGSLVSKNLGEKDFKNASKAAENGLFLAICGSLVFAVLGGAGAGLFFEMQTKDALIASYGSQYMRIVCIFSLFSFLQISIERIMQAVGKPVYTMIQQITGAVINIVLDPVLIFGLFGFPQMGVAGAAVATVTGQCAAFLLAVYLLSKKVDEVQVTPRGFHPDRGTVRRIYRVGIPSIFSQALSSVMTFGMNNILMAFSSTATAVFGVYYKLQSFVYMPLFGLNAGIIPIIAYNYGARNRRRITKTAFQGTIAASVIMLAGLLVFHLMPEFLMRNLFHASDDMVAMGVTALRTISCGFVFSAFSLIAGAAFQALQNSEYSLLVSFCRMVVVVLPSAYILGHVFGLAMVWWALPLAEFVGGILSVILYWRIYQKKIKQL